MELLLLVHACTLIAVAAVVAAGVDKGTKSQEAPGEEAKTESANPPLDPHEDGLQNQVRLEVYVHLNAAAAATSTAAEGQWKGLCCFLCCRYNSKRRHWRRTKLGM